jgi:hypothetical protein
LAYPWNGAGAAAEGAENRAIFGTRFAKTQHGDCASRSQPPFIHAGLESGDLFDRNRKPPDQPCNLVQPIGIVIFNGLRKPKQAFVVAHRGYVARNDRRYLPDKIGLAVWHRITSGGIRRYRASSGNAPF